MDGGSPAGDSVPVAGPSGTGKPVLAARFIAHGAQRGEPGVLVAKMRGSEHGNELRSLEIGAGGLALGPALTEYGGLLGGSPRLRPER